MGWAVVPWDKKNNPYIVETLETKVPGCVVRSEVASPSLSVRLCLRDQVKSISVSLRLSASSLLLSEQDLFVVTIHRFAQRDMEGSAFTRKAVCGAFFPLHRHVYSFHHLFNEKFSSLAREPLFLPTHVPVYLFSNETLRLGTRENTRARMHSTSPWDAPRPPSLACRFGSASYV